MVLLTSTPSVVSADASAPSHIVIGTGFAHADGRYHLFYDTDGPGGYAVAYAWSEDGLHWVRPDLGLVTWKGDKENNGLAISPGPEGSWNDHMMCSCGVLYSPDKWRMWIAGYHKDAEERLHSQMTLLESPDPVHWQMVVDRPVVPNGPPGTFDHGFTRVPCVIKDGDKFRMYYTAGDGRNGWFVGYAESRDGLNWTKPTLGIYEYAGSKDNNLVLGDDPARGESRVCHPWVLRDGDIYRIYYSVSVDPGTYCVATATSQDGIHWVKDPQVVILPRGAKGSFDYWYAAIPKVVRDAAGYKMWYTGYNGGPTHVEAPRSYALGYATSSDGVHWKKYEGNPVFGGNATNSEQSTREESSRQSEGRVMAQQEFIEVRKPEKLGVDRLPAHRVPLGPAYKPCIAALPDGELLVAAFRSAAVGDEGKYREDVILFRSEDGGRTWSDAAVLDGVLGREPYITVLRDGTLLVTALFGHDCRNTLGWFPAYIHRSEDGGHTWTSIRQGEEMLPPTHERGTYQGNQTCNTRNVLEMADGSLLMGVSVYGMRRDVMWRSTDGGRTWAEKYPSGIEGLPQDYPYGAFQEAVLWQARSGKLYMIARRDHRVCSIPGRPAPEDGMDNYNCMVLYSSTNLGKTWEPVGPFGDYGEHYPAVLRLADGRLLLTFTVRSLKPPLGLRAVLGVEHEDGFAFDFEHDRIMLDTKTPVGLMSGGGFGPTVQLADGTLVSSYSYRDDGSLRLEVVRWRLPDGDDVSH